MTGASMLLAALGVMIAAAGFAMFAGHLVAIRRRTRSANLEYGVAPAVPAAIGLWLFDWAAGWPGLPGAGYFLVWLVLAVAFCLAVVRIARR